MENFEEILNEINETIDEINKEVLIYKGRQFLLYSMFYYEQKRKSQLKKKMAVFIYMLLRAYSNNDLHQQAQSIDE